MENYEYFDFLLTTIQKQLSEMGKDLPSVSQIARENNSPYRILISTLISLRTKDSVTLSRSRALFEVADDFEKLSKMSEEMISSIIYPSAFYKRKGKTLREIANIVVRKYNGELPDDLDEIKKLPGVGIKTASLVLNIAYRKDAICVDCHVHEIVNRLGIIRTKSAEESEKELRKILPRKYWIDLNELLVSFGQSICLPLSPLCSECQLSSICRKVDVIRHR